MSTVTQNEPISDRVARRFLQTIVVVDDEAFLQQSSTTTTSEAASQLQEPSPRGIPNSDPDQAPEIEIASDEHRPPGMGRQLDAKLLIDSFALQGLVCAILAPGINEQLSTHIKTLSENADVIVLDWTIHKDGGATAISIIEDVIKSDKRNGGRLRLIVIYTGEPNIEDTCVSTLRGRIPSLKPINSAQLTLQDQSTRIVFYRKRHDEAEGSLEAYKETELPAQIVREFTNFAGGVLPNSVMSAIAAIRERTHNILARFSATLDGSYLAHRMLLLEPDDSAHFLYDLIGDEVKCILETSLTSDAESHSAAIQEVVRLKCDATHCRNILETQSDQNKLKAVSLNEVEEVVAGGINATPQAWGSRSHLHKRIHPLFHESSAAGRSMFARFACLSSLRRDRIGGGPDGEHPPVLGLGTVMTRLTGEVQEFYVCLQPPCDCARLKSARPFVLGNLVLDASRFDIVVPNTDGKYVELRFDDRPFTASFIRFSPTAGYVKATQSDGRFFFIATDGSKWEWIGDLRPQQAQRLVHRITTNLSRIGLDEFEWQRKYAGLED